jgi:sugar lactone lactonase YvrE
METKTTVLVDTLRFPECPRWHEGKLWCSDFFAQRVVQVDLQGNVQAVVELPDIPTGLGWTPDGRLLVVAGGNRRLLRLEDEELVEVADLSGLVSYPCNELVVDGQGRAYIGNIGFDFGNPEAEPQLAPILLVTPEGNVRVVADGLAFPNGMVITPDGQTLIVAESYAARLTAFALEPDGSLSPGRVWAQFENPGDFSEGQITPDGICLDAEGAVWVASPNTRDVLRVREGAEIIHRIPLDTIPLACMLGGSDRRTLFIATTESLDPTDRSARGRIETICVDVPGAELP